METTPESISGACLCGSVRFSVATPTLFCGHCHCTMCQRAHGAGYVTWFAVPYTGFSLEQGKDDLVRYASSDHGTRSFCGRCGSSLFCESTHHADHIDIVLANMEAPIDRLPNVHIYYSDRAAWMEVQDDLPKLGGDTGTQLLSEPR